MCTEYVYTLLHTVFMCFLCFYGFSCFYMFLHEKSLKIDVFGVRGGLYNDHPRCGYLGTTPPGERGRLTYTLSDLANIIKSMIGDLKNTKNHVFLMFLGVFMCFLCYTVYTYMYHPRGEP